VGSGGLASEQHTFSVPATDSQSHKLV